MSNHIEILDEITVYATPPTPAEEAEFWRNERERERREKEEWEKAQRSDSNERAENKIENSISFAEKTVESISKDLATINHESSFKDLVDKTLGNLKKFAKGVEYKDYLNIFHSGVIKNNWVPLEKKIYDSIEFTLGATTAKYTSKAISLLFQTSARSPLGIAVKAITIAAFSVGADSLDVIEKFDEKVKSIKEITGATINRMILEDIQNKRALGEALDAYNKALQTPINPSSFPVFLTPPSKNLIITLLKTEFERNFNRYLGNPSLTAPSNTDNDHLSAVKIVTLSQQGTLLGGNGNDHLSGSSFNDIITGGAGKDIIYGGNGNDKLFGMSGNDILYGGDGDDLLEGREGNDILHGGKGNDVLAGGEGADIYHFTLGDGSDTIVDNSLNNTLTLSKIDHKNLWFTQKYSHLNIHIRGSDEKIQFQNWFKQPNSSNKIIAGDKQVTYQQVVSLVSAMAAFSTSKSGDSPLADNLQQQLNTMWLSVPQNS